MRIKVVEAMAMGKPVVTTPLGAQGLDVLHEYNMIIAVTPEEYRFQLEKLILEPDYCKKIGRHARDFVIKNLNNAVLANRLTEFYTMHLK
jgi:glycosyltransferase involved in cell wall biosynthesis